MPPVPPVTRTVRPYNSSCSAELDIILTSEAELAGAAGQADRGAEQVADRHHADDLLVVLGHDRQVAALELEHGRGNLVDVGVQVDGSRRSCHVLGRGGASRVDPFGDGPCEVPFGEDARDPAADGDHHRPDLLVVHALGGGGQLLFAVDADHPGTEDRSDVHLASPRLDLCPRLPPTLDGGGRTPQGPVARRLQADRPSHTVRRRRRPPRGPQPLGQGHDRSPADGSSLAGLAMPQSSEFVPDPCRSRLCPATARSTSSRVRTPRGLAAWSTTGSRFTPWSIIDRTARTTGQWTSAVTGSSLIRSLTRRPIRRLRRPASTSAGEPAGSSRSVGTSRSRWVITPTTRPRSMTGAPETALWSRRRRAISADMSAASKTTSLVIASPTVPSNRSSVGCSWTATVTVITSLTGAHRPLS